MNSIQAVHVGMINSYNLLLEKVTINQIIEAGIGLFAHVPDEEVEMENVEFILYYFQEKEMFEHCAELLNYIKDNFNEDGSHKEEECECDLPTIKEYTKKIKCSTCNKRLKR